MLCLPPLSISKLYPFKYALAWLEPISAILTVLKCIRFTMHTLTQSTQFVKLAPPVYVSPTFTGMAGIAWTQGLERDLMHRIHVRFV